MLIRMSVEQADHFMRHIERHAQALREGNFSKGIDILTDFGLLNMSF